MLYEKKMLILSGDGKGVVLIEKCATGVRFTMRTFDLPQRYGALKVGIVTRSAVYVRDLPNVDDPAATFSIDVGDISVLHFAVFDKSLRLYGTNAKRMWEANLMDLLIKHDRPAPETTARPTPSALPPLSAPPQSLPLPDGTGIPQSRLSIYGDEVLAESDFYTPLDMSARMKTVDNFLDTPRVLDELAPRITPHEKPDEVKDNDGADNSNIELREDALSYAENIVQNSVRSESAETDEAAVTADVTEEDGDNVDDMSALGDNNIGSSDADIASAQGSEIITSVTAGETSAEQDDIKPMEAQGTDNNNTSNTEPIRQSVGQKGDVSNEVVDTIKLVETVPEQEAAATVAVGSVTYENELPWEMTARYLKTRSTRRTTEHKPRVKPLTPTDQVRRLRECAFFERTRNDIETLFNVADKDATLKELLPDIEWVKVEFDGRTISVGRGGNAFLCYAVAGGYEKTSPLGDEAQWLPRDRNVPTGKGYWLIFQNLTTGEIIKN